jgi:hypothetical protein
MAIRFPLFLAVLTFSLLLHSRPAIAAELPDGRAFAFLQDMDFSAALAALPAKGPEQPSPFSIIALLAKSTDGLSPREQRFLSSFTFASGGEGEAYNGIEAACFFEQRFGRLPKDGTELFASLGPVKTLPFLGKAEWTDMSLEPSERIAAFPMVFDALNPATGRVVESYSNPQWTPLGIDLRKTGKRGKSRTTDTAGKPITDLAADEWHLVVYGEEKDKKIIDRLISIDDLDSFRAVEHFQSND